MQAYHMIRDEIHHVVYGKGLVTWHYIYFFLFFLNVAIFK